MTKIVLATQNKNKIKEVKSILREFDVVSQKDIGFGQDVVEDGLTFEQNAIKKAKALAKLCNEIVVADDSGLEVDFLDGRPGVFSHRYAGEGATDLDRIKKLLGELKQATDEQRAARFVCAVAACFPNGKVITVRGECNGTITNKPVGDSGFGYDPVFLVPDYGMTFAELDPTVKNKISHRAIAFGKLKIELSHRSAEFSVQRAKGLASN